MVDVATRWNECVAIPNRSQMAVTKALENGVPHVVASVRFFDEATGIVNLKSPA
jgi:hypothetical protein